MGLLDKIKAKGTAALGDQLGQSSGAQKDVAGSTDTSRPGQIQDLPLGPESVVRFRKQRGVNLGQSIWLLRGRRADVAHCTCRDGHRTSAGAWFSQEAWIADEPFKSAAQPRSSDVSQGTHSSYPGIVSDGMLFAATKHDIAKSGGKEALERHWDTWITEEDWKWIVDKGFNTVRLPVSTSTIAFGRENWHETFI